MSSPTKSEGGIYFRKDRRVSFLHKTDCKCISLSNIKLIIT